MRTALYILGALVLLAGTLVLLLEQAPNEVVVAEETDSWPNSPESADPLERADEIRAQERDAKRMSTRLRLPHGTLTVRARIEDGELPVGVEVGYRRLGGEPRWLNVREDGSRTIVDAPLGAVVAIARGPGLPLKEQKVHIEAGVAAEAVITLEPAEEGDSVRTSGG